MVVIEMGQLTAYEPITTDLLLRYSQIGLKRFEVSNKKLVLYLDEVQLNEVSPKVQHAVSILILLFSGSY